MGKNVVYVVVKYYEDGIADFYKVFSTKEKAEKFVNGQYEEEEFGILEEELN